jgi:hypothetical protein
MLRTYHSLEKWHTHLFEKLGWMILAKAHGRDLRVASYIESIELLITSLNEKKAVTQEQDRKNDLDILLDSAQILYKHATLDLVEVKNGGGSHHRYGRH